MMIRRQAAGILLLMGLGSVICLAAAGGMAARHGREASRIKGLATAGGFLEPGALSQSPVDVWLHFHEAEICQDLDSVFVFHEKGVEVWCQVEDEKGYQKLAEMILPLQASFQIDIYATRPPASKKEASDKDPPPSLWNNSELINYLRDPFGSSFTTANSRPGISEAGRYNEVLKQRLTMYAVQVLDWNRKLKRYAAELPDLAQAGFGAGLSPDQRKRAARVCRSHTQSIEKLVVRLTDSLVQALPKSTKGRDEAEKPRQARTGLAPIEAASQLSSASRTVSGRIYRFFYPQQHTVELMDLREPSLLESLRLLREMLSEFRKAAAARS